jgi:uncharacterized protein
VSKSTEKPNNGGRIGVIDAVRGFAILGILFANIQSWSGYKFIPLETIEQLPYFDLDSLFNTLQLWVIDGKFYAMFSMLFGVGFGLQYSKYEADEARFLPTYRRRQLFLLLFGVIHALIWSGDILVLYALLAFVMIELRRVPNPWLLPLALGLLAFFLVPQAIHLLLYGPVEAAPALAHKTYPDVSPQEIVAAFGSGGLAEAFSMNLHNLYWRWLDFIPNGRISRVLGIFMLGYYLARTGYFSGRASSWKLLGIYLIMGLVMTRAAIALDGELTEWASDWRDWFAKSLAVASQGFLAMFYTSVLAILYNSSLLNPVLYPLTLVGRMAFTSYLSQTLIGILIFYGIGFGYFGQLGLAQLWALALIIYAFQVLLASLWLRYFRQGPVEWVWRCLTAGKYSPNLR